MHAAVLILLMLIAVAALVTIARRLGIIYPIFLLIGGLALGLVPWVPRVQVDPDVIFLVVLPPLLYIGGYLTPVRGLRANLGTISSLAVALVIATAAAVALVAHALITDITWPVAFALGAIVAPPDAIAAMAIAARLSVPRQIMAILEGESLLNDATALTLYSIALATAMGGPFSGATAVTSFAAALLGGGAVGAAIGWVIGQIRMRLQDTPVEITISLLTPYAAFLSAERLGASGVIATVVAGLYLGYRQSRITGADARLSGRAVWEILAFLLNGFVFILMGLEVPMLLRSVPSSTALRLVGIGLVVCLVLVAVRALFVFGTVLAPWLVRRGRNAREGLLACPIVLSWSGMRGVVSLAAALALPMTTVAGDRFPARDALLIVTLTVIVFTLIGQGLTLPALIRRLDLGPDVETHEEENKARQRLVEAAVRRLDELYPVWPQHRPLLDQLREMYRHRSQHVNHEQRAAATNAEDRDLIEHREIRRTVIGSEREALTRLHAEGEISDEVLRGLEHELDLEEQRMDA